VGTHRVNLRDRIIDAEAKLVVTSDGAYRKGKPYMLKPVVDTGVECGCECVKNRSIGQRNREDLNKVVGLE
jgi:acetyl-CoA synthetase